MNKYTFYYYTSQEDYINGSNMREYVIHSKSFTNAIRCYTDFLGGIDSCKISCVHYYCNSSLRAIPEKYIHLVNTHFVGF